MQSSHKLFKIIFLPHNSRLVFRKTLLHFIGMVSLVTLHGLVVVLIKLLSSLIDCSHVFRLERQQRIKVGNEVSTLLLCLTWVYAILLINNFTLGQSRS